MVNSFKTATRGSTKRCVLVAMVLAVPLLSGCGAQKSEQGADPQSDPVSATVTATEEAQMINGMWRVIAVNGSPVKKSAGSVTLNIDTEQQRVTGHDGCNKFMGSVSFGEVGQLAFSAIGATKIGCPPGTTPEGFYQALSDVQAFKIDGDQATLVTAAGNSAMDLRRSGKS